MERLKRVVFKYLNIETKAIDSANILVIKKCFTMIKHADKPLLHELL